MVGDEEEDLVPACELTTGCLEPSPQRRLARGLNAPTRPTRVGKLRSRLQPLADLSPLDEPEVGRKGVAHGEVSVGSFAVRGEDVRLLGHHASALEEVDHVLHVMEVAQVVRGGALPPINNDRMDRGRVWLVVEGLSLLRSADESDQQKLC